MARTKAYTKKVFNKINYVNSKIRAIEKMFGTGSEQYRRYINATTAALPTGSYTLDGSGKLRIKGGKAAAEKIKIGQINPVSKLPTAKHSLNAAKKSMAKTKLAQTGRSGATSAEISEAAIDISDQEALQELVAKSRLQDYEDSAGKLKYDVSVKAEMSTKGRKTYSELIDILEKGKQNAEKRQKKADYQRKYRAEHREEVNRKQREYRARRRAANG